MIKTILVLATIIALCSATVNTYTTKLSNVTDSSYSSGTGTSTVTVDSLFPLNSSLYNFLKDSSFAQKLPANDLINSNNS